jgi:hypothetical protein
MEPPASWCPRQKIGPSEITQIGDVVVAEIA